MVKKKTNNPLKMWGGWVGAIAYTILYKPIDSLFITSKLAGESVKFVNGEYIGTGVNEYIQVHNFNFLYPIQEVILDACHGGFECIGIGILALITLPITGFFIGWGIHSLLRAFSKK